MLQSNISLAVASTEGLPGGGSTCKFTPVVVGLRASSPCWLLASFGSLPREPVCRAAHDMASKREARLYMILWEWHHFTFAIFYSQKDVT